MRWRGKEVDAVAKGELVRTFARAVLAEFVDEKVGQRNAPGFAVLGHSFDDFPANVGRVRSNDDPTSVEFDAADSECDGFAPAQPGVGEEKYERPMVAGGVCECFNLLVVEVVAGFGCLLGQVDAVTTVALRERDSSLIQAWISLERMLRMCVLPQRGRTWTRQAISMTLNELGFRCT
jgi:hypothetical protein